MPLSTAHAHHRVERIRNRFLALIALVALAAFGWNAPAFAAANVDRVLADENTVWTYLDNGVDPTAGQPQRSAWATPEFTPNDDWKTASGLFGAKRGELKSLGRGNVPTVLLNQYLENGDNVPAFFFRTEVTLSAAEAKANQLVGTMKFDDSITVWVNGERVGGSYDDGITSNTEYGGSNKKRPLTYNLDETYTSDQLKLREGVNVIGVEVHNGRASSSDVWFSLESLRLKDAATAPKPQVPSNVEYSHIALNIGANSAQRLVSWFSNSPQTKQRVQVSLAANVTNDTFPTNLVADAVAYDEGESVTQKGWTYHHAAVEGLQPNTQYAYRVGYDGAWSNVERFTTGTATGDFNFIMAGDPQIGSGGRGSIEGDGDGWVTTMNRAEKDVPDSHFILSLGDQINAYTNRPVIEKEYEQFFRPAQLRSQPLISTIGNHDIDPAYEQYFPRPNVTKEYGASNPNQAGGNYWFTYNGVFFVNINTNDFDHEKNAEYLRKVTAEHGQNATWKVAILHHNMYSTAAHANDKNIVERRKVLSPVFSSLGYNAVVTGHDHIYTRSYLMNGTNPIKEVDHVTQHPAEGDVLYITANSASGSKFYRQRDLSQFNYVSTSTQTVTPNWTKVTVRDDEIEFVTKAQSLDDPNAPAVEVDRVVLKRRDSDPKPSENDTTAPVISAPARTVVRLGQTVDYLDDVTVRDNVDGTIPNSEVKVSGTVDTSTPGEYVVTYTVTDKAGNTGTATRTFVVKAEPTVIVEPTEVAPGDSFTIRGTNFDPTRKVTVHINMGGVKFDRFKLADDGSFAVTAHLPKNAKPGNYTVRATQKNGTDVGTTLKVSTSVPTTPTPTSTPAPTEGPSPAPTDGPVITPAPSTEPTPGNGGDHGDHGDHDGDSKNLPDTGAEAPLGFALLAALMLIAGAAIALKRKRA